MKQKKTTVNITIDNKPYRVSQGLTILEAAQQHDVYIPTLCYQEELTPYGGCRMCVVEVEGMRNLPTACTTPVTDGMVIRTHTAQVQATRREILHMFLSEHPSSCLICGEKEQCCDYMGTIRKSGVTTGCRYCSNDGQCELQDVVDYLEIKDIQYPIYYRQLPVEKEDPFYDRDYNLCILCGRCVRVCQELRTANVLAFNDRGRETTIGPAFNRSHYEAGCEFCGACVSVCPTGSLTEKARAWEGKPEKEVVTTCSFCGVGCQLRLLVKGERVIGSLPGDDDLVNNGQLCVKGRFCITESVGGPRRLRHPYKNINGTEAEISWDEAVAAAAEKLSACAPGEVGMIISPNCTNEDLYAAQKFMRTAVNSHNIDTSTRAFYGNGFNAYLSLARRAAPLSDVRKAGVVLCIGLDTRFGRSVVGVELRKAVTRGAKIVSINPRDHSFALISHKWVQPVPGQGLETLQSLVGLTAKTKAAAARKSKGKDVELGEIAELLKADTHPVILLGSEFLQYDRSADILTAVEKLADNVGAAVLPLPAQNNFFGTVLMGAYPEILPGGDAVSSRKKLTELKTAWKAKLPTTAAKWNSLALSSDKKLKVLYVIGELPHANGGPAADYVIYQNIYPPGESTHVDLVLPATTFTESDGTFVNGEGRIQRVRKAVDPPGDALPDWQILSRIAKKLGVGGFDYATVNDVHKEIAKLVDGFKDLKKPERKARPLAGKAQLSLPTSKPVKAAKADKKMPFIFSVTHTEHSHRGFPLSGLVAGACMLFSDETLDINPDDARKAKIQDGDTVEVISAGCKRTWPARIVKEQAPGTLHVALCHNEAVNPNPQPVRIRKTNV